MFLNISQNSQENTRAKDSFLKKFIIKESPAKLFSCEFWEIFKNTFFTEHLWWLLLKRFMKFSSAESVASKFLEKGEIWWYLF